MKQKDIVELCKCCSDDTVKMVKVVFSETLDLVRDNSGSVISYEIVIQTLKELRGVYESKLRDIKYEEDKP